MSARCKRKDKGGVNTIEKRVTVGHSNAANADARKIRCCRAPTALAPTPTPSPSPSAGICLSTDARLFPCPPAKRPRCSQHQQRGKKRTKERQGTEGMQQTCDVVTRVDCPRDTSVSPACRSIVCSTANSGVDHAVLVMTSLQKSSDTINAETSPREAGRSLPAYAISESGADTRGRVGFSVDASGFKRAGRDNRMGSADDQLDEPDAQQSSSPDHPVTDACVGAVRNGAARAADDKSVSLNSLQVKNQGDLLALASDTHSPTKKLLFLAESANGNDHFSHAEGARANLDDEDESDSNDEVELDALLLTGGSTQSCLLQTQERTIRPWTLTPGLLLNSCCSSGVRTPLAGSPLSMSSQASTNSAFSASPLTCCSSIGPSSVPATPSCWLSDELSPEQTQRHQTRDGACPAGAVSQKERQKDASLLLWEAIASSTPVRSSAAVPSNITAIQSSPNTEEEDGCTKLLSLSYESSRLYNSQHLPYPNSQAAADNCSPVKIKTSLLSGPAAIGHPTETACSRVRSSPTTSLKDVECATEAFTAKHVKIFCNGGNYAQNQSSTRDIEAAETPEGRRQTCAKLLLQSESNVQSILKDAGQNVALEGSAQYMAASERALDVFSCITYKDGGSYNDRSGESRLKHRTTGTVCQTIPCCSCSDDSPLSSAKTPSGRVAGAAAISLPLQLPIPARAPRGKPQKGQVACLQQRRSLLSPSPSCPRAAAENENTKCTATPAEESGAMESTNDAADKDGNTTESIAIAAEKVARTDKRAEETSPHNSNFRLPSLLEHTCNIPPKSFPEDGSHQKETCGCGPQLPGDPSFFTRGGEIYQQQQAAALNAMERAAVRAKLAARAAAVCAAVIDAAAAAARNAAAVSAANRGSAGTTAGEYTEYPDMQRNIHDDYDLFCNPAAKAEASLTNSICTRCTVNEHGFDIADVHERLWKPLGKVEGTENELLCAQGRPSNDGKHARNLFYWSETTENGVGQCYGRSATSNDIGSECTGSTDRQENKSEQIVLRGKNRTVCKRRTSAHPTNGICDVKHQEELACVTNEKDILSDSERQRLPPSKSDSRRSPYPTELKTDLSRESLQEAECHEWTGGELKASKTGFSRSSSTETDASKFTRDSTSSSCAHCSCSWCRKCTCSKISSRASSPRSRSEYAQMSQQRCCDRLVVPSSVPLEKDAGAQHYKSLPAAVSHENDLLNCLMMQPACVTTKSGAVGALESVLQSPGRDLLEVTQAVSTVQVEAQIHNIDVPFEGRHSGSKSSAITLPSTDSLKGGLGGAQEYTNDTSETTVPAAHISTSISFASKELPPAPSDSQATLSDKRRGHVVLGAGRFGKVVLGQHNHSGLLVAVKIIDKSRVRGAGSEKDDVNFRQEIEMHSLKNNNNLPEAALDAFRRIRCLNVHVSLRLHLWVCDEYGRRRLPAHRNIVTLYDVYEDRKSIYLVMELCDRVSLLDKLAEEGPLREDVARQIFLQILAAVKHCHDHQVIHRDLKPENVLFAHDQQPTTGNRRRVSPGSPLASALNRACRDCRLLKTSKAIGSPTCKCIIAPGFWTTHDDNSRENKAPENMTYCNTSPGCCCAKQELVHRSMWPSGDLSVNLHYKVFKSCHHICDALEGKGSDISEQYHERKGSEERCIRLSSASNLEKLASKSRNNEAQQHIAAQTRVQETHHSQNGLPLAGLPLQHQRTAAQSGSLTPESIPCGSYAGDEGVQPSEHGAAWLRNLQSPMESTAARDTIPCAVNEYCCCRRCEGHDKAAKRAVGSTRLFDFHTSQQRDRVDPPTVKLIDLGAACSSTRGQLRGTACGTTHYLAPEVLTGNYYDGFASDVWSLGVILFTMLSGAPPFDGLTHSHLTRQIVRGEYRMDGPAWWKVSADAKNLILRLLDVNPQTRNLTRDVISQISIRELSTGLTCELSQSSVS